MLRITSCVIPLAIASSFFVTGGPARGQYGAGWNGWGASGGQPMARGLGNLYAGRGTANESNAIAGAINTDTAMRWNNALYRSSRAGASRYNAYVRAEDAKTNRDLAMEHDRIRNHPEDLDISSGETLNALMTDILSPRNAGRSLAAIRTPLRSDVIAEVPFEYASEDITFCLHQMTMEGQWPLALNVPAFQADRDAVHRAVTAALQADEKGNLSPQIIAAVTTAVANLRARFEREVPASDPNHYPARATIKALAGLTKMLDSPKMEQVLAELEDYQGTTLGDLLAFMQSFNLRFAPANSFRQKAIYRKLYPMLRDQADGATPDANEPPTTLPEKPTAPTAPNLPEKAPAAPQPTGGVANDLKSAATDLFKDMKVW